jgi:hypothetical protein
VFAFVQVEAPWALGPADGRYVVRGHAGEPAYVLVLRTLGAPVRRTVLGRPRRERARRAEPAPTPTPVTTTRATLVHAQPLAVPGERWLREADLQAQAERALRVLNDVLHAHRLTSADPSVHGLPRREALVVRVGIGAGEAVADGRWTSAVTVPSPLPAQRGRERALRPQERLAAVLGGRDVLLACEELTLRTRHDADAGRWREAAFGLRVALEAAIAELQPWSGQGDVDERIAELRDQRPAVGAAANAALEGGLAPEQVADVVRVLDRLEAALRARTAAELR